MKKKIRYAYFVIGKISTGEKVLHRITKSEYDRYKKKRYEVRKERLRGKGFVPLKKLYSKYGRWDEKIQKKNCESN